MVDRIQKVLEKLTEKERQQIRVIVQQIVDNDTSGLDIKKIKGASSVYRVRKGDIRIVFSKTEQYIQILQIERRNEKTYRKF